MFMNSGCILQNKYFGAIYSQVSNNRLIGAKSAITGKLGASSFFKQLSK
jgi:hypothetical protein